MTSALHQQIADLEQRLADYRRNNPTVADEIERLAALARRKGEPTSPPPATEPKATEPKATEPKAYELTDDHAEIVRLSELARAIVPADRKKSPTYVRAADVSEIQRLAALAKEAR